MPETTFVVIESTWKSDEPVFAGAAANDPFTSDTLSPTIAPLSPSGFFVSLTVSFVTKSGDAGEKSVRTHCGRMWRFQLVRLPELPGTVSSSRSVHVPTNVSPMQASSEPRGVSETGNVPESPAPAGP